MWKGRLLLPRVHSPLKWPWELLFGFLNVRLSCDGNIPNIVQKKVKIRYSIKVKHAVAEATFVEEK